MSQQGPQIAGVRQGRYPRARASVDRVLSAGSFGLVVALSLLLATVDAAADITKAECIEANTKAQDLRRDGNFTGAREQLRKCGDASCPAVIRDDCTKRIDELDKAQPSIVFEVKDDTGKDLTAVKVSVDGRPWLDHLAATAVAAEPGEHTFRFELAGKPPVDLKLFIREAEKDRHERVVIATAPVSPSNSPAASAAGPAPEAAPMGSFPALPATTDSSGGIGSTKTIGLIVGGVGLAGLAVGSIFGGMASADWSSAKNECSRPTSCTNHPQAVSDHDSAITMATVSTVGFIAGGVTMATGAVLWLTAPSGSGPAPSTGLVVAPEVGPSSAGVLVHGAF